MRVVAENQKKSYVVTYRFFFRQELMMLQALLQRC